MTVRHARQRHCLRQCNASCQLVNLLSNAFDLCCVMMHGTLEAEALTVTYVMVPPLNLSRDMIVRLNAVMRVTTKLRKGVILASWAPAQHEN